ncbi:MAG: xylulokinase [Phycisphaerales bacterium]|nr:xylulokinase [Phycisphaerales bacterium]
MPLLLGIDIGTSSTKALIIDGEGAICATASAPLASSTPHPSWSEQNPDDWWASSCAAVRAAIANARCNARDIAGVGLSGQMHGSVLLDAGTVAARGERAGVLRPAILWNDQRTAAQCAKIERLAGGRAALVRLVGNAALPGFTLPKLLWVREHEPETWPRVAAVLLPKDYVRFRLTGVLATDVGDAAGTLLFDVDRRAWSPAACNLFDIDPAILPPVLESAGVAGLITRSAAEALGLPVGAPVVAGSGDNQCGAIGAGVVEPNLILATLGTSGVVYAHASEPWRDLAQSPSPASGGGGTRGSASVPEGAVPPPGRVHTMCAADGSAATPGHWSITGCSLSAGGALAWARDHAFGGVAYDTLFAEAADAPPGCDGLVFLPYLTGERCPHPDPSASGAWIGLTSRHTRAHMARAILEGVALTMREILDIMRSIGVVAHACRLGGGGTRSSLWRDILLAAMGVRGQTMQTEEGPALGAALLAGVGTGVWHSVPEACRRTIHVREHIEPNGALVDRYNRLASVFAECYAALQPTMAKLGEQR